MIHNANRPLRSKSLSARRAWIEIPTMRLRPHRRFVALRKESVDRNMTGDDLCGLIVKVALRKESVDRNNIIIYY